MTLIVEWTKWTSSLSRLKPSFLVHVNKINSSAKWRKHHPRLSTNMKRASWSCSKQWKPSPKRTSCWETLPTMLTRTHVFTTHACSISTVGRWAKRLMHLEQIWQQQRISSSFSATNLTNLQWKSAAKVWQLHQMTLRFSSPKLVS